MSSEEIKTIYKKLVESYVNDFPHGNPLWILNRHIEAYVKHEWKTERCNALESAILDLALKTDIEIPEVKELIENGKTRKEAIKEVSKKMEFQVSETEAEQWVKAKKEERAREEDKKSIYTKQRIQKETKEHEKSIERLTTLFSKGEISEESYKRAIKTIERNIEQLRSGKEVSVSQEKRKLLTKPKSSYPYHAPSEPTGWWYLVPLFFGLLGGLIGYVGVKDEDREMANNLLVFGFFMTIVDFFLTWFLLFGI